MYHIINRIAECLNHGQRDRADPWDGETIHRYGVEGVHNAIGVAMFDRQLPQLGSAMAYHFVISPIGVIEQALPIGKIGWHAMSWSKTRVGIACLGDFTKQAPSAEQWAAAHWLVTMLMVVRGSGQNVTGHDELPGGSRDLTKRCPGDLWSMDDFRREVTAHATALRRTIAQDAEIVL